MITSRSELTPEMDARLSHYEGEAFGFFISAWGHFVVGLRRGDWNSTDAFIGFGRSLKGKPVGIYVWPDLQKSAPVAQAAFSPLSFVSLPIT
jgi:hypothetical protein